MSEDYTKVFCDCGHHRSDHDSHGLCTQTRVVLDYDATAAKYGPDPDPFSDDPWGWPANWPPAADCPTKTAPCDCTEFTDAGTAAAETPPDF